MGIRDQIHKSLQNEGIPGKSSLPHSKAYHRYFEGYSEVTIPNLNGKGYRIHRIYTGNSYRQDLKTNRRILLRGLYVLLFILIVYLFGSSASEPLASNTTWYVVLTQVVCLPFLFWILIAFFTYLPSWRDQTIHEYRSSSLALQKAGLGSAISLGAAGMVMIVFTFLNPSVAPHLELQCAGKYLAAGLLALLMNRVEKNVPYLVIPSQNLAPEDAVEI